MTKYSPPAQRNAAGNASRLAEVCEYPDDESSNNRDISQNEEVRTGSNRAPDASRRLHIGHNITILRKATVQYLPWRLYIKSKSRSEQLSDSCPCACHGIATYMKTSGPLAERSAAGKACPFAKCLTVTNLKPDSPVAWTGPAETTF